MDRTLLILGILLTIFTSCTTTKNMQQDLPTGDNSRNALDWAGLYSGVLYSEMGDSIQAMIKLNADDSYELQWKYLGKRVATVEKKGKFTWDAKGSNITLESVEVIPAIYKVGEHKLFQVDKDGKILPASRQLFKDTSSILEKYWKLVEVNGKTVMLSGELRKGPHMILKVMDRRVSGNGSCNGYGGTYHLSAGNKIHFSPIISTKMACSEMEVETAFFNVFQSADHYTVSGDSLSLHDSNKRVLARFVENKQK